MAGSRRICETCQNKEKKSGFNLPRLAIILFPLSIILLFTYWYFYSYNEDPAKKIVRDYEITTGFNKNLQHTNYRLKGLSTVRIKRTEPDARGFLGDNEDVFAFEMVFTKNGQYYVDIYRDPLSSYYTNSKKSVFVAGSNGYRHWQSKLNWSVWAVEELYKIEINDSGVLPSILLKNVLLGLNDIKSFSHAKNLSCQSMSNSDARRIMSSAIYTFEGKDFEVYPCENIDLSVQDNKGFSSTITFDPQTNMLIIEKGSTLIENKNADIERRYSEFKKYKLDFKSGDSKVQKEVIIPTMLTIMVGIGNIRAAYIRLNIQSIETDLEIDPLIFEKPVL